MKPFIKLITVGAFALLLTFGLSATADASEFESDPPTAIDHFVDCDDSFWAVACAPIIAAEEIPKVCEAWESNSNDCWAYYTFPIRFPLALRTFPT